MRAFICFLLLAFSLGQLAEFPGYYFEEKRDLNSIPAVYSQKLQVKKGMFFFIALPANKKPTHIGGANWNFHNKDLLRYLEFKSKSLKGGFFFPDYPTLDTGLQLFSFMAKQRRGTDNLIFNYQGGSEKPLKVYKVAVEVA